MVNVQLFFTEHGTTGGKQLAYDKPDVVNMSYGNVSDNAARAFNSIAVNNVMIANPDMVFVASAGNEGVRVGPAYSLTSPGPGSKYITAANIRIGDYWSVGDERARFDYNPDPITWSVEASSSRGPVAESFEIKPDLGSHGYMVLSAVPPWNDYTLPEGVDHLGFAGGTSMAAPHISGAAALLVQYSSDNGGRWTADEIKSRLMNNALPFGTGVGVFDTGAGYADVYAAAHSKTIVSVAYDRVVAGNILWPSPTPAYDQIAFTTTETGSFSFGNVGKLDDVDTLSLLSTSSQPSSRAPNVRTLSASIQNNNENTLTYTIEPVFTSNPNDAATLTFSRRGITVDPGETAEFTATVSVRGTVAAGYYEGYVHIKESGNLIARLPFALVNQESVNVPANELRLELGFSAEYPLTPGAIDPINVLEGTRILDFLTNYHDGVPAGGPVREGYRFQGWYLDAAGINPLIEFNTMPNAAITLYARWAEEDLATVTGIAIKTQPTKLSYAEGHELDLSGLLVTLTYSDASTEDVSFVYEVGETVNYAITVKNLSTARLTNVVVTDTLPAELEFVDATIVPPYISRSSSGQTLTFIYNEMEVNAEFIINIATKR